jgi:Kef-type K+ transport system membrane component KefB
MSGPSEKVELKTVIKGIVAIFLILLSFWVIENPLGKDIEKNSLLALGLLVLGGLVAGRLCQIVGLPSLTGYLGAGIFLGPSALTIIDDQQVDQLRLVNSLALALIALHAGCEFTKEMLQNNFKSLFYSTWAHILVIGAGMTAAFMMMSPWIDFLSGFSVAESMAIAAVFAAVAVSKSPAAVVAILGETKIKNILSEHALGIVVILDVVVLVLFSVVLAFAKSTLNPEMPLSLDVLGHLFSEIIASIAAGTFFGLFMIFYLKFIDRERMLFVVAMSYGLTAICSYLHYDTLLVFVVAGFVVTNFSQQAEKMIATIESLSSIVMIVFFATAGASLHLQDVLKVWQLVLVMFMARAFFTWLSEDFAHRLAKSPPELKKYGFTPFISQAGLSIGLSMIIYDRIPEIGPKIAALAISVVTLNEIFGPVLFKWGLNQVERKSGPIPS